jgi:hypothetical protein
MKATREQLEREVFEKLHIQTSSSIPAIKKAISMKTTAELEDLLKRMNAAGR